MDRFGRAIEVLDARLDRGFDGLGVKRDLRGTKVEAKVEGLGQDDSSLEAIAGVGGSYVEALDRRSKGLSQEIG